MGLVNFVGKIWEDWEKLNTQNPTQRPSSRSKRQAIEVEKTEHEGLSGEPGEAEQEGSGEPEVAKKGGGVSLGKILGNLQTFLRLI